MWAWGALLELALCCYCLRNSLAWSFEHAHDSLSLPPSTGGHCAMAQICFGPGRRPTLPGHHLAVDCSNGQHLGTDKIGRPFHRLLLTWEVTRAGGADLLTWSFRRQTRSRARTGTGRRALLEHLALAPPAGQRGARFGSMPGTGIVGPGFENSLRKP